MRKLFFMIICCFCICIVAFQLGILRVGIGTEVLKREVYQNVFTFFIPEVVETKKTGEELLLLKIEHVIFPSFSSSREGFKGENEGLGSTESGQEETQDMNWIAGSEREIVEGSEVVDVVETEVTEETETEDFETEETVVVEETIEDSENTEIAQTISQNQGKKRTINREKLKDFDFLRQNFYQIDNTTTADSKLLNVEKLLATDVKLKKNIEGPQILIYHTHSQECYKGYCEGDEQGSVLAVGDYLTKLLTENYGIQVLHHKGKYDVGDRAHAYSNTLPAIQKIMKENPSIELAIDLHRDGIPENVYFKTEIEGRPTAKIMFFNGLSRTTAQGPLTYLKNPSIEKNLALSFQLQLAAAEYYPDFTRKIYLKGFRYNQHICDKCVLIEVGAQNNSLEEAMNAMIPLADVLHKVLVGE